MERKFGKFVWEVERDIANIAKHRVDFITASRAFLDIKRKIFVDSKHSIDESRYFCIGMVKGRVITVRFTYREGMIRIFGAGYWRKGKAYYEKE
ncbi:MAG: BrnT family toxin [Candidatus Omnitrophota bacterium]|nr:BrnT family toxin [Candidatus Omnitrophota bacterium]